MVHTRVISTKEELPSILETWPGTGLLAFDVETSPRFPAVTGTGEDGQPIYDEKQCKVLGLDWNRNRLRLIQFSDGIQTIVVNCDGLEDTSIDQGRYHALKVLQPLFEQQTVIGANLTFDITQMQHHTGVRIPHLWDLSIMERALTAGAVQDWHTASSLKSILKKYLDIEIDKEIRAEFGHNTEITPELIEYAAGDVHHLIMAYAAQRQICEEEGLLKWGDLDTGVVPIEMGAVQAVVDMQLQGMYVSKEIWTQIAETAQQGQRQAFDDLQWMMLPQSYKKLLGESGRLCKVFAPNSSPDTVKAFQKYLGVKLADRDGKPTTDDRFVKAARVAAKRDDQKAALTRLLDYKGFQKQVSTYGISWLEHINPVTGRVHQSLDQYGAETARYSSAKPNLQNVPVRDHPEYRTAFVVPDGYALVGADFAGCELRCLAWLSQDAAMMSAYNNDPERDIHIFTAAMIYQRDYDEMVVRLADGDKETKKQRTLAKSINFGICNGIGANKVSEDNDVDLDIAKNAIAGWRSAFPSANNYLNELTKTAWNQGVLYGIAGHRRYFPRPDPNMDGRDFQNKKAALEREARNWPVQNANAVLTKRATYFLPTLLAPYGAKLCHVVHDEIVAICDEMVADEVSQILVSTMIDAGNYFLRDTADRKAVRMNADSSINTYWAKG